VLVGDGLQQVDSAVDERVLSDGIFDRVQRHDETVHNDQFHLRTRRDDGAVSYGRRRRRYDVTPRFSVIVFNAHTFG